MQKPAVDKRKRRRTDSSKRSWQLQDAKAHFSEVFRKARSEGPQIVTRQSKEAVIVISYEQYARLVGKVHQPK